MGHGIISKVRSSQRQAIHELQIWYDGLGSFTRRVCVLSIRTRRIPRRLGVGLRHSHVLVQREILLLGNWILQFHGYHARQSRVLHLLGLFGVGAFFVCISGVVYFFNQTGGTARNDEILRHRRRGLVIHLD